MKRTAVILLLLTINAVSFAEGRIDRRMVVERHRVVTTDAMSKSPAQVGNGHFAFGMDITGLQTFTAFNTLSDWCWHSNPLPEGKTPEDYHPVKGRSHGKKTVWKLPDPDEPEISNWLRSNPHRINLGRVGFVLLNRDGTTCGPRDISDARQEVDLWTGDVCSSFSLDGAPVTVRTVCHPDEDMVAVRVHSPLVASGRLAVFIDFPYSDDGWMSPRVGDYSVPQKHSTGIVRAGDSGAVLRHDLDDTSYHVTLSWTGTGSISRDFDGMHRYTFRPADDSFDLSFRFSETDSASSAGPQPDGMSPDDFDRIASEAAQEWEKYWSNGGFADFSGSTDPRWKELERRVILSQYLMRLNESGYLPPQEAGLVNNGWYGRFHWEMIWWHAAHWYLWGRPECAGYLRTYADFLPQARERAAEEGRKGARWPKCTGNINREWPCDTHAWLMWQQPHPIWLAEAEYRISPTPETLQKWGGIVVETADYLASSLYKEDGRYVMGPPVTTVSENTDPTATMNPAFDLCYWRYGLRTALAWADRLGLKEGRTREWRKVLDNIAGLPVEDGYYITHEGMDDMWHKFNFEHPSFIGLYGWLPGDGVDIPTFRRTFDRVMTDWQLDRAWGWDYAVLAMAAARLGDSAKAVDILTTTAHKFAFDAHGLADCWPFPYFPANGGLLCAVAMLCAGWDGDGSTGTGAFPEGWCVRSEGLYPLQ